MGQTAGDRDDQSGLEQGAVQSTEGARLSLHRSNTGSSNRETGHCELPSVVIEFPPHGADGCPDDLSQTGQIIELRNLTSDVAQEKNNNLKLPVELSG